MRDTGGINVAMESEEVRLTVYPDRMEVEVTFDMVNHGEKTTFEEGFPVGWYADDIKDFSCVVSGKDQTVNLVGVDEEFGKWTGKYYWYSWKSTFEKNERRTDTVRYTVPVLDRVGDYRRGGYILRTGATWRGKINSAKVILTMAGGLHADHLRSLGLPLMQGGEMTPSGSGGRQYAKFTPTGAEWLFKDFEPAPGDDIYFTFNPAKTWKEEWTALSNDKSLGGKALVLDIFHERDRAKYWELASTLIEVPNTWGRVSAGYDYTHEWLLIGLFIESCRAGDREEPATRRFRSDVLPVMKKMSDGQWMIPYPHQRKAVIKAIRAETDKQWISEGTHDPKDCHGEGGCPPSGPPRECARCEQKRFAGNHTVCGICAEQLGICTHCKRRFKNDDGEKK